MNVPKTVFAFTTAVLIGACSSGSATPVPANSSAAAPATAAPPAEASASPSTTPVASATATATSAATPTAAATSAATADASASPTSQRCPWAHGSVNHCLGPIAAGTYTTVVFAPQLTFTVPDGWTNYEDLPGNFLIGPPGTTHDGIDLGLSDYIGVYTSIAGPLPDCNSQPDPSMKSTATGYVAWLRSNPKLKVSKTEQVTVNGLQGLSTDVALDESASGLCSDPAQNIPAFAEVAIGVRPSDFSASVFKTVSIRIEVFDVNGHVFAILLSDTLGGGGDYPDFWSSAQPVINSFKFATQ